MAKHMPLGDCPYKGLQPYTAADRAFFFGRERDQQIIVSNLYAASLTILYGGSGVGKSSVLLAGVVPQLTKKPRLALVVFRDWQGDNFLTHLKTDLLAAVSQATGEPIELDLQLPLDEIVHQCSALLRGPIFFILDQFEEYFLYHPESQGENSFDAELARSINRDDVDASFILSMREDGLSKLDRFQGRIPSLLNNLLRLEHLDPQAAREAIRKPLDEYNRRLQDGEQPVEIEDELVNALLDELKTGKVTMEFTGRGQLKSTQADHDGEERIETPFLQMVLMRLWQQEQSENSYELRKVTLDKLGGPENIARSHLDQQLAKFKEREREMTAELLRYLVTPSGAKIAQECSALASWTNLNETGVRRLLNQLSSSEMRILRTISAPGQPVLYEIFHDVLGRAVVNWRARRRIIQEQRRARLWRVGVTLLTLSLIMMVALGLVWRDGLKVQQQVEKADQLAKSARAARADPELELLLAVEAVKIMPTKAAVAELQTALESPLYKVLNDHSGPVRAAVFSPDGKWIATASEDKTALIWDRGDLYNTTMITHPNFVMNVAFSPDSQLMATACKDGIARLYKVGTWDEPIAQLSGHNKKSIRAIAFSPDNSLIVTGSEDDTAVIWQRNAEGVWQTKLRLGAAASPDGNSAPSPGPPSPGHTNFVQSATFSHDGKLIVTASRDSTIKVWQVADGKVLQTLQDENVVRAAVFSPDDQTIVSGNESCQIKIWLRNGNTWGRLDGGKWMPNRTLSEQGCGESSNEYQHGFIDSINFDPKGQFLIAASRDHKVFERDVTTWKKQGKSLVGHEGEVYYSEYSPDGKFVISASEDHKVILWEPRATRISSGATPAELINMARARFYRQLNCDELRRFQLPCTNAVSENCCCDSQVVDCNK